MGTIPTIPSFTPGATLTAAQLNKVKEVADFWALTPRCYAYVPISYAVATGTITALSMAAEIMDIVQSGDTPMHDNVTNTSRIYIRTAGKYEITGQVEYAASATGTRSVLVRQNGSGTNLYQAVQSPVTGNATTVPIVPFEVAFAAGDYVEMFAYQTSGGNLNIDAGQGQTFLRVKLTGS